MGYISSADQRSLGQRYRMTAILVAGFGITALVFILLPMILRVQTPEASEFNLPKVLATSSLLLGLASVLLRRVLLSRAVLENAAKQGRDAVLSRLSMTSVISAAFGEAVGIAGLVGFLMTGASFAWPVGAVSLILVAYSFPRRAEWVRALELVAQVSEKAPAPVVGRTIEE
jgi:hypothetical protein